MSVLCFCFLSVIFVVVFRSMKRRREKTRVSFRLRGADAVTAILFFSLPLSCSTLSVSIESAGWFQFSKPSEPELRNSGRTGMAMVSRRQCGSPCS